jgi:hypothetical protein
MSISFIGGGNRRTRREQPTCRKSLTNLSHNIESSTPRHERDSNLQLYWLYALIAQVVVNLPTIQSYPRQSLYRIGYGNHFNIMK